MQKFIFILTEKQKTIRKLAAQKEASANSHSFISMKKVWKPKLCWSWEKVVQLIELNEMLKNISKQPSESLSEWWIFVLLEIILSRQEM